MGGTIISSLFVRLSPDRQNTVQTAASLTTRNLARSGYTLFEMLLVLSLIVLLLGVAYPTMARLRLEQNLKQAAEQVRLQMMAARLNAMSAGFDYQFRYEPAGKRYLVVPADYQEVQREATPPANVGSASPIQYYKSMSAFKASIFFSEELPPNSPQPQPIAPEFLQELPSADDLSRVTWAPAIRFKSDGSSQDLQLDIKDTVGRYVRLEMRGLTGGVTVSQIIQGKP